MIDLHCHTYFSDGVLSPKELIEKAQNHQISCLSLTDHDTVSGYPELLEAAASTSIKIINGIELSTRWKKYDLHILGYRLNHTEVLQQLIQKQVHSRIERAKQIGDALVAIGVDNAYEKACALAGHARAARPHFAKILVSEGKARDMQSAFDKYLVRGRIAYIPTPWISVPEAIEGIVADGGQAVIAHPLKYGLTRTKLHELINEFKEAGGVGIEVVSGDMALADIHDMAVTSMKFGLFASSGSDFHGDKMSRVNLGRQRQLPDNCVPIWQEWNI